MVLSWQEEIWDLSVSPVHQSAVAGGCRLAGGQLKSQQVAALSNNHTQAPLPPPLKMAECWLDPPMSGRFLTHRISNRNKSNRKPDLAELSRSDCSLKCDRQTETGPSRSCPAPLTTRVCELNPTDLRDACRAGLTLTFFTFSKLLSHNWRHLYKVKQ